MEEKTALIVVAGIDLFLLIVIFSLDIWAIFVAKKAQHDINRGFDFDGSIMKRASRAFRNSMMFK